MHSRNLALLHSRLHIVVINFVSNLQLTISATTRRRGTSRLIVTGLNFESSSVGSSPGVRHLAMACGVVKRDNIPLVFCFVPETVYIKSLRDEICPGFLLVFLIYVTMYATWMRDNFEMRDRICEFVPNQLTC